MIPERYTLSNLIHALRNPSSLRREFERIAYTPVRLATDIYLQRNYEGSIDVMSEDWDNLFILDACRYDYFKEVNHINGDLSPVVSPGHRSWEFMDDSFVGRDLQDTVYVTANPHAAKLPNDIFHAIEMPLGQWNDDIGVILPEDLAAVALSAYERYSNKRLIVHFMQPHLPHLGPTAETYRERVNLGGIDNPKGEAKTNQDMTFWEAIDRGIITVSEARVAYQETLEIVLNEVEDMLGQVEGRTVVTADHGQLLGEKLTPFTGREYGHPYHFYSPNLRIVPWLKVEGGSRRRIVKEEPTAQSNSYDQETIETRLSELGYT